MNRLPVLWRWLALIFVLSFGALGFLGWQIHLQAPPIPSSVATADGDVVFTGEEIGVKRLEARPVATLSIEAQERRERREKQYGDRDDRYR